MFALKDLMTRLGSKNIDARQDGAALDPALGRASYLFNATIAGIEQADALLIVGAEPAPRGGRAQRAHPQALARRQVPGRADRRAGRSHLSPTTISAPARRRWPISRPASVSFAETLKTAERPLIIVGAGALARPDGAAIAALAAKAAIELGAVKEGWNGFCVLHTAASRVGALDIGFVPGEGGLNASDMAKSDALDVLFLLGADEIDVAPGAFVVYIGSHGDSGAHRADVILPGAAYTEKSGIYVNTEGRVQMASARRFPPGEAREDWAILRALSDVLGVKLPYDSLAALRAGAVQGASASRRASTRSCRAARRTCASSRWRGGDARQGAVPAADRRLLSHQSRSRAPPPSWRECSALAEARTTMTAAE